MRIYPYTELYGRVIKRLIIQPILHPCLKEDDAAHFKDLSTAYHISLPAGLLTK
jgi:hypothetical protein